MSTLGSATGASVDNIATGYLYVCGSAVGSGYLASESGTITKLTLKMDGTGAGTSTVKAAVYSETSSLPAGLVCYSANVDIAAGAAAAEVDFSTLTPSTPSIVSGTRYWIGYYIVGVSGGAACHHYYTAGSSGITKYKSGQPDPPPDPFPASPSSDTEQMWAYITYAPAGASSPAILPNPIKPNFIYLRKKG